ncbi:MAG: lectin like domain-containing protein [Oscillospiraceae bacterium]|nr:lectin like domain-containing protein [Oscillospiraceae bacterium]
MTKRNRFPFSIFRFPFTARRLITGCLAVLLLGGLYAPVSAPAALALEIPDTTAEAVRFTQRGTGTQGLSLPPSFYNAPNVSGQGADHTAWAFAACAALEEAARVSLGYSVPFSANHMRYALSSDSANVLGFPRAYTAAGNRSQAAAYLMRGTLGGPVYASLDPYSAGIRASGETEAPRPLGDTQRLVPELRATGVIYIPDLPANPGGAARALYLTRLKEHIYTYGAVAASLYYDGDGRETVYRYTGGNMPDHSVALAGWDDDYEYTVDGVSGRGAFRAADSAYDGGRGGVYYITYDTAFGAAYTIEGLTRGRFDKTYEYDPFGLSGTAGFSSRTAYFAGVFTVGSEAETVGAVTFFAAGEDTRYEIYLARAGDGTADEVLKAAAGSVPAAAGTAALPGYYTIELSEPWPVGRPGEKFVVAVRADTPYETAPVPLQGASLDAQAAAGRSYLSADGVSWVDAYSNNRAAVCVKAHVSSGADIPLTGISLRGNATDRVGGISYPLLRTAPGQSTVIGPVYEPSSAGDAASVEWFFGDAQADGDSFYSLGTYSIGETPPPGSFGGAGRDELDLRTGRFTARALGRSSIRCVVTKEDGTRLSATMLVEVKHIEIREIVLELESVEMKTNQTQILRAAFSPSDATVGLTWHVARDADYTPYPLEFDPARPYREDGPIATVDENGKVRPIQPGLCYVYAASEDGLVRSDPCEITILEVPLTGVTLPRRTLEMPLGTAYTLTGRARPADATYQDFSYLSSNGAAVMVDAAGGILYAVGPGEATVTVITRDGYTAECLVTVTRKPSRVVRTGGSYTAVPAGMYADKEIHWAFEGAEERAPLRNDFFVAAEPGRDRLRVTARAPGGAYLRAWQEEDYGTDEMGQPVVAVVWEQSFALEAVEGTPRLQMLAGGQPSKSILLCVDPLDPARADSVRLTADPRAGDASTLLAFEWTARDGSVVSLRDDGSDPLGGSVVLTALRPGKTKITALNYNGERRVSLTVRVVLYPERVSFGAGAGGTVRPGKKLNLKARVNAGDNHKTVRYEITDAGGNAVPHSREAPIAVIHENGRLTAVRPGRVRVTARAAPYDESAAGDECVVEIVEPVGKLSFERRAAVLAVGGTTSERLIFGPAGTSQRRVTVLSENPEVAEVRMVAGRCVIKAVAPGRARIVVQSADRLKIKATFTVTVR